MAHNRPVSMVNSTNMLDETHINGPKNHIPKKETFSVHSSDQQTTLMNNLFNGSSSSSSIDSTGTKNAVSTDNNFLPETNSTMTVSSTTTDSEIESEQDEQYIDDNLSELNNTIQIKEQELRPKCDNIQQKVDVNVQEQLSRRVRHFQKLFKSEISDDMPELIDSYVCAYQGDILLQGKMYITDRYLCFHSRIISYVTKHVHRWNQIENVTKERVAFIFPTAIGIQLKHTGKKVIYASFLQRDQAFDKIMCIWSRYNNDTNSFQDDDERRCTKNTTLKAVNRSYSYNEKIKRSKSDLRYQIVDEPEQDDVLQMCLESNAINNDNKRRLQFTSSRNYNDKTSSKHQGKKCFGLDKAKLSRNPNIIEHISYNNESNRSSCSNQSREKETDVMLVNSSVVYHRLHGIPLSTDQNRSRDQTISPTNHTSTNLWRSNSSPNSNTNSDSSTINSTNNGQIVKYCRIIILSIISIVKLVFEYLSLLFGQVKTYPIKISLILLIFVTILIVHSFYLIKLACRIENRLQSIHHMWPSSIKQSR